MIMQGHVYIYSMSVCCVCTYVCTHVRMYACMYACMYVCMYLCLYVHRTGLASFFGIRVLLRCFCHVDDLQVGLAQGLRTQEPSKNLGS